jgi:hypothetical protein
MLLLFYPLKIYEVMSKIFRTGAAIYTGVVARSTGRNRSNCEFRVLLRSFVVIAREDVRRRRPAFWREQTWLLHHDNAPSHTSVLTQQFLAKYEMVAIPHPPYSPVWHPVNSSYFQK